MDPRYRLVLFDFDGTLADSVDWFLGNFNRVADRYRFSRLDDEQVQRLRAGSGRAVMKELRIPHWKLPFIARHLRRLMTTEALDVVAFPGVDDLLRRLSESGVTLAVVTSNAEENVRRILGAESFARLRYLECGVSMFGKRARFRRVLRRSGVRPDEALCIGDEIRDHEAARAAGIPFGAVVWGYTTPEALLALEPEETFRSLEEIVEVVTRGRSPGA